jgi:hypothetical protein
MLGLSLDSLSNAVFSVSDEETMRADDSLALLIDKIRNSMKELGGRGGSREEVADAYQKIRDFSLGENPDFEIRLDHITDSDGWGDGRYSGKCIDGVFAFLVYYKRKQVLTMAFSVMGGKKLLVGQVQTATRSKGWDLSLLPPNRLEFAINCFMNCFPGYTLYLVDGKDLVNRILNSYRESLKAARLRRKKCAHALKRETADSEAIRQRILKEGEHCKSLRKKIVGLMKQRSRLITFYSSVGRYTLGPSCSLNKLRHHRIIA